MCGLRCAPPCRKQSGDAARRRNLHNAIPVGAENIVPSRFHAPPMITTEASQISCGGPPEMSIFFSLLPA